MQTLTVHKRSLSTGCLTVDGDGSTTEMQRAQSNSLLLTVPSQPFHSSESKKFVSLTDLHTAANDAVPITCEQRSSSGPVLLSTNYQSDCNPRLHRASSNFLSKKTLPHDKQLRRVLKKAGKYAGIDITTGFTTVVQKPPRDDRIPRKIPQDASYNPSLTLSPLIGSRHMHRMSADHRESVTIVAPLCELDHAAKHTADDFQLHVVLSVDAGLIKDADESEFSDRF